METHQFWFLPWAPSNWYIGFIHDFRFSHFLLALNTFGGFNNLQWDQKKIKKISKYKFFKYFTKLRWSTIWVFPSGPRHAWGAKIEHWSLSLLNSKWASSRWEAIYLPGPWLMAISSTPIDESSLLAALVFPRFNLSFCLLLDMVQALKCELFSFLKERTIWPEIRRLILLLELCKCLHSERRDWNRKTLQAVETGHWSTSTKSRRRQIDHTLFALISVSRLAWQSEAIGSVSGLTNFPHFSFSLKK